MDIGKIVFEEFDQWVYNTENQAGDKLQVIDASDLPEIIQNVVEKSNVIPDVSDCDKCYDTDGFYLGMTCPKCNRPFRSVKS